MQLCFSPADLLVRVVVGRVGVYVLLINCNRENRHAVLSLAPNGMLGFIKTLRVRLRPTHVQSKDGSVQLEVSN